MSGRKKKLRMRVIDQMLAGQITVPEARAQMAWIKADGSQAPPRAPLAAVKSAAPGTGYEMYYAYPDPQIREWAAAAAERAMVTKGLLPGSAAASAPGEVRALVRGCGPDGSFGWRQVRAAAPSGPPVVPPGVAGR